MDAKLVNPFVDAFTTVMPQIGFPEPKRLKMNVRDKNAISKGVSVIVGVTKQIRGNVVYNMSEETAKFIASTMMMGMPVNDLDELAQSAISELVNMLTANVATNFSLEGIQIDISTPTLMKGEFSANACTDKVISVEMAANDVVIDMNISLEKI